MKRLVISGSPRAIGRCYSLAEAVSAAYGAAGDTVELVSLGEVAITGCIGCNTCSRNQFMPNRDNLYCIFADNMVRVRKALNGCDALSVVAPVYYSGAPSQLKAFYDRLQPYYFYRDVNRAKRPADLYVVGSGGDPHGYGALVSETRSALAVAGFRLQTVHDWVRLVGDDGSLKGGEALTGGRIFDASEFRMVTPLGEFPRYKGQAAAQGDDANDSEGKAL